MACSKKDIARVECYLLVLCRILFKYWFWGFLGMFLKGFFLGKEERIYIISQWYVKVMF